MRRRLIAAFALAAIAMPATAQQVECEEFVLDNGMKFLLYPRTEQPHNVVAGWVAKVGSVNERPGITGISHFFEHMMFKGTDKIGTQDPQKDAEFRREQKQIRDEMQRLILTKQYDRWRRGEITDPWNPEEFTPDLMELRTKLKESMDTQKDEFIVNNEFDQVYTEQGASGMNAFTSNDLTFYFINVPANKFELWAWMESDRLSGSVFREFYSERDVVHEERRLRTESTPTGIFQEQFESMFWMSSPYHWPVIGWSSDLNAYTMEQAWDYFETYYQPANLTGVIVGDFDPAEVKPIIREYFSQLSPGSGEVPPVVTLEMPQQATQRMIAECDCQPQVEVRYHAVPFGHKDEAALDMLANVLNGRTGRLYKSMVEGEEIAQSAFAAADGRKYGGAFSFNGTTKGEGTPEDLEAAWYAEVEKLQTELVGDRELQKVKNQALANSFRRLQNNFFLLVQIGYFEGLGDWNYINEFPKRQQAVTPEDIQRVANEYFDETNSSVAIYYRKEGTGEAGPYDHIIEKLPPEMQGQVKQQLGFLMAIEDVEQLSTIVTQMESSVSQAPPNMKEGLEALVELLRSRIEELTAAESNER